MAIEHEEGHEEEAQLESAGTTAPQQGEMPFAIVEGTPVTELPKDLYIPPHALEVFLEAFEGPLDLLLYLIKRQNIDILDIPIAEITKQYMEYVDLMKEMRLELAAEYLVMAAMLAEIKSRMLLPRPVSEEDEDDPRSELVRRLQEYEVYRQAAEDLRDLPQLGRDVLQVEIVAPFVQVVKQHPQVSLDDLIYALKDVLERAEMYAHHQVQAEPLSVRERMSAVLDRLDAESFCAFTSLFSPEEGRQGVVVTLLALLELIKEALIELVQADTFSPIHVRARA